LWASIDFELICPAPSNEDFSASRAHPGTGLMHRIWCAVVDWWWNPMNRLYEWYFSHWGCLGNSAPTADIRAGDTIKFITGGEPPLALMRTLSTRFPELFLTLEWVADADLQPSRVQLHAGEGKATTFAIDTPEGRAIVSRVGMGDLPAEIKEEA
jgi:hypothetical protein